MSRSSWRLRGRSSSCALPWCEAPDPDVTTLGVKHLAIDLARATFDARIAMPFRKLVATLVLLACCGMAGPAGANNRGPFVTWPWLGAQLVPSPELVSDAGRVCFGMRWQLTPVLLSYGIHRSLPPWRSFVVEPIVRTSGSTELYLSPEYFGVGGSARERFGLRSGLRSYLPVVQRGDYLSLSFGASWLRWQDQSSVGYEAGAHVLFGFLGAIITYSPTPSAPRWIASLEVRIF